MLFENFISDDLNTLADEPRKGKATPRMRQDHL